MTTPTEWFNALRDLPITGVKKRHLTPPLSLNATDLPAQWVMLPSLEAGDWVTSCENDRVSHQGAIQVAISPLGEGSHRDNFNETVAFLDNLHTALKTLNNTVNFVNWTIQPATDIGLGKVRYWGYRVTVTGRDGI